MLESRLPDLAGAHFPAAGATIALPEMVVCRRPPVYNVFILGGRHIRPTRGYDRYLASSFAAILTRSAREAAFIFCMILLR
jgi:hypothetical protein